MVRFSTSRSYISSTIWPRFQPGATGTPSRAHSLRNPDSAVSAVTSSPATAEIASYTVTSGQSPPMSCSDPSARLITVDPKAADATPCTRSRVSFPIVL